MNKEEAVYDNIQHTLSTASDLTARLALLNASYESEDVVEGGVDWEKFDETVGTIDDTLESVEYDWQVFKENYAVLKEKHNE